MIADDHEVDVLLLGQLHHLQQVATEQSCKSDNVVVQVQALDGTLQGQLVLAWAGTLFPGKLPHDELCHAHAEGDVKE